MSRLTVAHCNISEGADVSYPPGYYKHNECFAPNDVSCIRTRQGTDPRSEGASCTQTKMQICAAGNADASGLPGTAD